METLVIGLITESAQILGLDASDLAIQRAITIGVEAVQAGYGLELSHEFGRSELLKAAQFQAA